MIKFTKAERIPERIGYAHRQLNVVTASSPQQGVKTTKNEDLHGGFCRLNRFSMSTRSGPWHDTPTNTWTTQLQVSLQPGRRDMSQKLYAIYYLTFCLCYRFELLFPNTFGFTYI